MSLSKNSIGAKSATAASLLSPIRPCQCSAVPIINHTHVGGPATLTADLRHQGTSIHQESLLKLFWVLHGTCITLYMRMYVRRWHCINFKCNKEWTASACQSHFCAFSSLHVIHGPMPFDVEQVPVSISATLGDNHCSIVFPIHLPTQHFLASAVKLLYMYQLSYILSKMFEVQTIWQCTIGRRWMLCSVTIVEIRPWYSAGFMAKV
jgi:hypothetical protein